MRRDERQPHATVTDGRRGEDRFGRFQATISIVGSKGKTQLMHKVRLHPPEDVRTTPASKRLAWVPTSTLRTSEPPAERRAALTASGRIVPGRATSRARPTAFAAEPITSAPMVCKTSKIIDPPAIEHDGLQNNVARTAVRQRIRHDKNRHARRMIRTLHEWQTSDHLRRVGPERAPSTMRRRRDRRPD